MRPVSLTLTEFAQLWDLQTLLDRHALGKPRLSLGSIRGVDDPANLRSIHPTILRSSQPLLASQNDVDWRYDVTDQRGISTSTSLTQIDALVCDLLQQHVNTA